MFECSENVDLENKDQIGFSNSDINELVTFEYIL